MYRQSLAHALLAADLNCLCCALYVISFRLSTRPTCGSVLTLPTRNPTRAIRSGYRTVCCLGVAHSTACCVVVKRLFLVFRRLGVQRLTVSHALPSYPRTLACRCLGDTECRGFKVLGVPCCLVAILQRLATLSSVVYPCYLVWYSAHPDPACPYEVGPVPIVPSLLRCLLTCGAHTTAINHAVNTISIQNQMSHI